MVSARTEKGRLVQTELPAAQVIDVDPLTAILTVTNLPTFVYVPAELKVPTTTQAP